MKTQLIRFIRNVKLLPSHDFNKGVQDKIYRAVGEAFNNSKEIEIDDFLSLLTFDNLTEKAFKDYIENDLKINFTSIGLDFISEVDRKPKSITPKNRDNFKFRDYWFIAFSENYELIEDNQHNIKIFIGASQVELNIQQLKNMNITYQSIDY